MDNKANDLEPTRQSLLARLPDLSDRTSWSDFFNQYWRLIYAVARRAGLSDAESQEVVQETVLTVSRYIETFEYDPERCRFKTWLLKLTRHRIVGQLRKRRQEEVPYPWGNASDSDPGTVREIPDPAGPALEILWDEEWQQHLLAAASAQVKRQVKGKQFQIYDLYVLQNWPVRRVAKALKVSATQVYLAKHRVGRLMRQAIRAMEARQD